MSKKRMGAVFLALLICNLVSQASAQNAEPKFNSNGDDLTTRISHLRSPRAMIWPTLRAIEFPPWLAKKSAHRLHT